MKKLGLLLLFLLAFYGKAEAQGPNYIVVTASNIENASGANIATGNICAQGVRQNGVATNFQVGGGGQVITSPVCRPILNGVISQVYQLANPSLTAPANILYHITVRQNGIVVLDYPRVNLCAQSGSCDSTYTFNFDNCVSSGACQGGTIPPQYVPAAGPPGEQGETGPAGPGIAAWSGATTYSEGAVVSYMGQLYSSIAGGNLNHLPTDTMYWEVIAGGTFEGGDVLDPTFFLSGIPHFDVKCIDDATADTAALQAAITAAYTSPYFGEIWIQSDGTVNRCQITGSGITFQDRGGAMNGWLVIRQFTWVHVLTASITLQSGIAWYGARSVANAILNFTNAPGALVTNGAGDFSSFVSAGNQSVWLDGLSIWSSFTNSTTEPAVLFTNSGSSGPTLHRIRNSTITVKSPAYAVSIASTGAASGFGITLEGNSFNVELAITPAIYIENVGNVTITGPTMQWFTGGGVKLVNSDSPNMSDIYLSNIGTESFSGPFVETTGIITRVIIDNVQYSDNLGTTYVLKNNTAGGLTSVYINRQNFDIHGTLDPTSQDVSFAAGTDLTADALSVMNQLLTFPIGSLFTQNVSLQNDLRRSGSPSIVSYANLAAFTPVQDSGSCTITSTGIADPFGGTSAHRISSGSSCGAMFYRQTYTPSVGDRWVMVLPARANSSAGFVGTTNAGNISFTSGTVKSTKSVQVGTYLDWKYLIQLSEVTAVSGDTEVIFDAIVDSTHTTDYYGPVLIKIPNADSMSDAEAIQRAMALTSYSPDCTQGQQCDVIGPIPHTNQANTWTALQTMTVPSEAYDATGWNGDTAPPNKDDVRDQIEAMLADAIVKGTLTTTAATSDNVAITGVTASSKCSMTPTEATGATNMATTYISSKTTNQITVTHAVVAGMVYDILCSKN